MDFDFGPICFGAGIGTAVGPPLSLNVGVGIGTGVYFGAIPIGLDLTIPGSIFLFIPIDGPEPILLRESDARSGAGFVGRVAMLVS